MASQNGGGKSLSPISGRATPAPDTCTPVTAEARPPAITICKRSTATTEDLSPARPKLGFESPGPKLHIVGSGTSTNGGRLPGPDFSTMHKPHGDKSRGGAGDQPGPGSYDPKDVIRSGWPAGITMGAPRHGDKPPATPGPGNYDIPDPRSESPAFSMGRKSSISHRRSRDIPGPGSYFITRHGSGTATDSMLTFSQGSPIDPENLSGVSSSSVSSRLRELPEHRRRPRRDTSPGPASYNVNSRFTSSAPPAFTFGSHLPHSIFDGNPASLTPGPGTYSLDRSLASSTAGRSSPSFTIQGRDSTSNTMMLRQSAATPGPGTYEQRSYAIEGPALSLGKQLPMPRQPYIPGPGAYHQEGKPSGPSFSLFRRNTFFSRPDRGTPGPGSYYNAALSRPSSPAFSMSTKSAPPAAGTRRQDTAPGPGSYNLGTTLEGPYYSLLSRTAPPSRKSFETPGPGRYNLDSTGRPDSPAFSFGCKAPSEVNVSPGPGQYDTQKLIGRPLSFTFGMRPPQSKRTMGPGPGTYEPISTVSGPSHSLHGRFRTSYTATAPSKYFPGPGTYNIKTRLQGPAFTLPCRLDGRRDAWRSQTPGPGAYELRSGCISHSPPRFSLGQRLDPKDRECRPGPGSYNLPLRSSAPAFSMLSRF